MLLKCFDTMAKWYIRRECLSVRVNMWQAPMSMEHFYSTPSTRMICVRQRPKYPTFWSSAPLATFLVAIFCPLLNANKCNYVGHWHTVKVLHKEGKGGQVSIQPFTAESNSLCHIHLHLHTYQVGRNLKLTNISIKFVPVMAQISFHAWASKNTIIKSVSWENFYSIWQIMFFS